MIFVIRGITVLRRHARREGDDTEIDDKEDDMHTARSHYRVPESSLLSGERNAL